MEHSVGVWHGLVVSYLSSAYPQTPLLAHPMEYATRAPVSMSSRHIGSLALYMMFHIPLQDCIFAKSIR